MSVTCTKDLPNSLHHFHSMFTASPLQKLKPKVFLLIKKQSLQRNAAETRKCLPALSFSYRAEAEPPENGPWREWKNPRHLGKAMS